MTNSLRCPTWLWNENILRVVVVLTVVGCPVVCQSAVSTWTRWEHWWKLEPHHDLITNQTNDATKRMVLAKSSAGDLAVAYLPDNPVITIKMTAFDVPMRCDWYNPKTGAWERGQQSANATGENTFERPAGREDALLVLRRR